ncbi:MAG: primosomal replication protein N [Pseudomonadota bacterium]
MENRLVIGGEIVNLEPLRFSPAGIPIARATLKHQSKQAGQLMQCELIVAAQGETAKRLAALKPGSRVKATGSITRAGANSRTLLMWIEQLTEE